MLFTIGLFYALLEEVYSTGMINGLVVLVAVKNVIAGNIWEHMWFVYAIIGIYLVMPVVHGFIKRERKDSFILTAILFAFNILFPVFQKWIPIGVELPFGGYLFYVCFGGLIAKYGIRKREMIVIVIAGLISAAYLGVHYNGKIAESIDLLAVCIMSLAVFLIFEHMKIKPSRLLLALAKCSWGPTFADPRGTPPRRFLIPDSVFPVTGGFLPAPYQYCLSDSLYVTLQARILQQPQK